MDQRSQGHVESRNGSSMDALAKVRRELRAQLRERVDARGLSSAPRTERRLRVREEALALMREWARSSRSVTWPEWSTRSPTRSSGSARSSSS